jgi:hypothetical protein
VVIGTVLGVHGVGVRGPNATMMPTRLTEAVAALSSGTATAFLDWGETCGAEPRAGGASLPMDEPLTGAWSLDYDPLMELRLLATIGGGRNGDSPARHTLVSRAYDLDTDREVLAVAAAAGLADVLSGAVTVVLDAIPTRAALTNAELLGGELRVALAWAIVATAMARAGAPGMPLPLDGDQVRAVADVLSDRLGGAPGIGPPAAMTSPGGWTARRRADLAGGVTRCAGDVARYLTNGAPLRAAIRESIEMAVPPVVVVAHSLGGVACVELLAGEDPPPVRTLITVGSPLPYLYEIDALPALGHGVTLPADFPRWLNVLDPRDLFAFAAGTLFAGHATDHVVDNGAPFPRAHSAYFGTAAFRAILANALS